uniref:Chronophin n=1 Tax=Sus scrofa TaxID=9823 RepID=A0A8D1FLW6_PIG
MARCERLRGAALRDVLGRAQGVLFDCDGVLWNGERAVPGAPELLERLARAGKEAFFVSNNSRRARPELALRFARLGFRGLRAEQLFSSALCAARLLRQRLLGPPDTQGAVFVLGGEGLRAELRAAGLRLAGDPGEDPGAAPRVRAVLVGYDEHFSFAKLSEACAHLRDPDCLLVATDRDPWHPLSDGSRTPVSVSPPPPGDGLRTPGPGGGQAQPLHVRVHHRGLQRGARPHADGGRPPGDRHSLRPPLWPDHRAHAHGRLPPGGGPGLPGGRPARPRAPLLRGEHRGLDGGLGGLSPPDLPARPQPSLSLIP